MRVTALWVSTLLWIAFLSGAGHAADAVAKEDVAVYNGKHAGASVITTLREGMMVDLGPCDGSWCPILQGPGKGGWVRAAALNMNLPKDTLHRQRPPTYPREVRVMSNTTIHAQPSRSARVIGPLRQGKTVLQRACRTDNWCPVSGGWVWGDFLAR